MASEEGAEWIEISSSVASFVVHLKSTQHFYEVTEPDKIHVYGSQIYFYFTLTL
jgi:hypothetical protein